MLEVEHDHDLVSSARVEGTAVYDRHGDKVGLIHSVMIHKVSGQTAYAVLCFGGFMKMGVRALPIPWDMLTFEPELHGYQLTLTREEIAAAPYMTLDKADRPHEVPEPVYRHWDQYL